MLYRKLLNFLQNEQKFRNVNSYFAREIIDYFIEKSIPKI